MASSLAGGGKLNEPPNTDHGQDVAVNAKEAYIVHGGASGPSHTGKDAVQQSKQIILPHQQDPVMHIGVDIGGSLTKVVSFAWSTDTANAGSNARSVVFEKFETENIDQCYEYLRSLGAQVATRVGPDADPLRIIATGGGAYKYYDEIREKAGMEVQREDEMECLIRGLHFLITKIPGEIFTCGEDGPVYLDGVQPDAYPYLVVNIGSGVSVVKVSGQSEYERVGGTSLGGGTLWGLLSLLTGADTYGDMLDLSDKGDSAAVDMLVKDIYGQGYEKIGLPGDIVASSFGKVSKRKRQGERHAENFGDTTKPPAEESGFRPEDITRSLFVTVSNNIAQIAYLYSEKHKVERIYFAGSFIQGHNQIVKGLSDAIGFWSAGKKKAYFLQHEGYLGSLGAFLQA